MGNSMAVVAIVALESSSSTSITSSWRSSNANAIEKGQPAVMVVIIIAAIVAAFMVRRYVQ